jgi:monothiol glutaredoxin
LNIGHKTGHSGPQPYLQEQIMLDDATKTRLDNEIASEDVVLFMKGTPVFPQCGFSAAVVGVLSHLGVKFRGINVLEDDSIREGIKAYSDWPTIPQLYVKGEFIGGCDIVREMYETGELMEMFQTHGVDAKPA